MFGWGFKIGRQIVSNILSMAFVCFCLCVGGYQINIHESSFTWYMISFAFNWVDVVFFYLFVGVLILSYYKEVMRCRCVEYEPLYCEFYERDTTM